MAERVLTEERWKIIHAAAQKMRERRRDGERFRWEEVAELEDEGLSIPEIARRLGICENTVRDHSANALTYSIRESIEWNPRSPRQAMADRHASVYSDPKARAWIYRQFGVEE